MDIIDTILASEITFYVLVALDFFSFLFLLFVVFVFNGKVKKFEKKIQ